MTHARPIVSVIMSVYNGERFVAQAVESILAQSYTDFEFIIIDDGSTDSSADIISAFEKEDKRIRLVSQQNTGLTKALNNGIALASGTYIARMDADDIARKDRLEKQVAYMDAHSDVAICGSLGEYIDEEGTVIGNKDLPTEAKAIHKKLLFNNQCIHTSLLIRASVLQELGGYNEAFRASQDYELLLRVSATYDVVNLDDRLVQWRVNSGSISWSSKRQEKDAIKARWFAITKYGYPFLKGLFHICIRRIWMMLPHDIKIKRYQKI